jgi:hypothetical protein
MIGRDLEREMARYVAMPAENRESHLNSLMNVPDGMIIIKALYDQAAGNPAGTMAGAGLTGRMMISAILKHVFSKSV